MLNTSLQIVTNYVLRKLLNAELKTEKVKKTIK
jgi:hypothetical protein